MSTPRSHPVSIVSADTADSLAWAAQAGIHAIPVPTPWVVGPVNAYLIEDEPLTLIDTGPNFGLALHELEAGINALGHSIGDLGLLVLTHPHTDHLGLADVLVRESGTEVVSFDRSIPYVVDFAGETAADNRYAERLMVRHGISPVVAAALTVAHDAERAWGASVAECRGVTDGEKLRLRDRTLVVHHRPGHSLCDIVLVDDHHRIGFTGDHLLKHISSNPLITRPLGAPRDYAGRRPRALPIFLSSLAATRASDLSLALPGHGEPISDHVELIGARMAWHERRAARIHQLIAGRPRTAHEIAVEMWGEGALREAYLTLCEVLGHIDLLVNDGLVSEQVDDNVARFASAR